MLNPTAVLAGAALLMTCEATAFADTSTSAVSADELRALQQAVGADQPEDPPSVGQMVRSVFESSNPSIALILDLALAYFSDEPDQLGAHDPAKTGFTLQQLELNLGAAVDPYFRLDASIVFGLFGVEVEEAYATTLGLPGKLQLRAGQFLTRFGRLNSTHPHAWSFADQPLVLGKFFGGEASRGLGGELSWLTPLPWYVELVASVGDAAGECCARSFFGADDLGVKGPEDLLYTLALKQFVPFDDSWSSFFGVSTQLGPNASGNGNRTEIYGADLYLRYRPVDSPDRSAISLQAEGLFRSRQVPGDALQDYGLYAQLTWNIDASWEVGARYELVSGLADDPLDPEWTAERHRAAAQLTFYPSHFSRVRVQGTYDHATYRDDPVWGAIATLELLAGAHGAHEF